MATMLETPSRIWRRIEAAEAREMPSLPSLPPFEDSGDLEESSDPNQHDDEDNYDELFANISSPMQSTPTSSHNTVTSTFRGPPSATSTARFAHSIASRSNKSLTNTGSRGLTSRMSQHESFDIPSLPEIHRTAGTSLMSDGTEEDMEKSKSIPDVYLPPPDEEDDDHRELSLTDALESISRSGSPPFATGPASREQTPKKSYDYSTGLISEPKVIMLVP